MKTFFKFLGSLISSTLLIPVTLALTLSLTWYVLPDFQTTDLGLQLSALLTQQGIFISTLISVGLLIILSILTRIFHVIRNSKINNFCLHVLTWMIAGVLITEACYTFFVSESLRTAAFELNLTRKIGLGAGIIAMLCYCILHKKLSKIIDRKIQAYATAKELNANGRSSVIWVNILKTIDFIFPEFLLLLMLCFAFSFEISLYFIIMISSFVIPVIGNMICDKRVKLEAIRKQQEDTEAQIGATAEAVVDLLKKSEVKDA